MLCLLSRAAYWLFTARRTLSWTFEQCHTRVSFHARSNVHSGCRCRNNRRRHICVPVLENLRHDVDARQEETNALARQTTGQARTGLLLKFVCFGLVFLSLVLLTWQLRQTMQAAWRRKSGSRQIKMLCFDVCDVTNWSVDRTGRDATPSALSSSGCEPRCCLISTSVALVYMSGSTCSSVAPGICAKGAAQIASLKAGADAAGSLVESDQL